MILKPAIQYVGAFSKIEKIKKIKKGNKRHVAVVGFFTMKKNDFKWLKKHQRLGRLPEMCISIAVEVQP